jgi:endo-1,4-beta-D-glucanase Y
MLKQPLLFWRQGAIFSGILLGYFSFASAQFLPVASTMPKVTASYDTVLLKTWQGIKKRNIDAYAIPLVHRPKSEQPGDAVSEGIGYGMILALYCNDQPYFNKIWDAGEQYMWQSDHYNWRTDQTGTVIGSGAASDAEEDIAYCLIIADLLVKKGIWQSHSSPKGATYAQRAQTMINAIWSLMVENGLYLRPGINWGGSAFVNPSYFAPAFYRIFDAFETQDHNWQGLIDQCYRSIAASPGYDSGLVPDWMKPTGEFVGDALGYNSYARGQFCYKDGIRVLWRLATDYLWHGEPRALAFLTRSAAFIKTPDRANFFQMNGDTVTDTFSLGNKVQRQRKEHSHLTTAMWAAGVMAAGGPAAAEPYSDELLKYYTPGADFWGKTTDTANEDTLHNEMYFDQFLAWFGASLLSGTFSNLWEDLNDSLFGVKVEWVSPPSIAPYDINANVTPLWIFGVFNKPASWSIEIAHCDSLNAKAFISAKSDTMRATWYGISATGCAMPQGCYTVCLSARGLAVSETREVWLGRALDLKMGTRLCIDDFKDGDLKPYIGNQWTSYLDSDEGKAGKSTIRYHRIDTDRGTPVMQWAYQLNGGSSLGYNPYCALEWDCSTTNGTINCTGLDTIIITARASSALKVSVQLVTTDITDWNFFEDSLTLTTQLTEYTLPLRGFVQRFGGSKTLDLSKMRALRLQVQNVDGTQNEIAVSRMLFAGSLDHLYRSPPPYVPSASIRNVPGKGTSRKPAWYTFIPGGIRMYAPFLSGRGSVTISDLKGKRIRVFEMNDCSGLTWDLKDNKGKNVRSGVYCALFNRGKSRITLPLFVAPR